MDSESLPLPSFQFDGGDDGGENFEIRWISSPNRARFTSPEPLQPKEITLKAPTGFSKFQFQRKRHQRSFPNSKLFHSSKIKEEK